MRLTDPRGPFPIMSKGLLVPCAALPPNTILITLSMVKAPAKAVLKTWLQPALQLEEQLRKRLAERGVRPDGWGSTR